ncbi:MAG: XrtA/PEP-CTERM system TPR-repeat protein PrsT [Nitrospirota bacterium]
MQKRLDSIEARYQLGIAYFETGQIDSAEKELKKAMKLQPSLIDAHLYLGKIYLIKGYRDDKELNNSINELKTYLDKKQGDPEALEVLGAVYIARKDFEKAHFFLDQAIKNAPDKPSPYVTLARLYIEEKNLPKSREVINNVISKNEKDKRALYTLCDLEKKEERHEDAIACYKRIIEIDKNEDLTAYAEIGILYIRLNKSDEALKTGEYIISKYPKKGEGYYIKGLSLYRKNNINETITNLQLATKFNPNIVGAHYFLGLAHYLKNELEQARTELYKVVDLRPDISDVYLVIGLINLRRGWIDEAIKEINKAIEKNIGNAFAYNMLGTAYMLKKEYDMALNQLKKAQELDPKLLNTYLKRGRYYFMVGESASAEKEFVTALNIDPKQIEIRTTLILYLINGKKYDNAVKVCKDGLKNKPDDALLYNLLGLAYIGKRDASSAISNFERAKSLKPEFVAPYMNLATFYIAKGDDNKALEQYDAALRVNPHSIEVLLASAVLFERTGNEAGAIDRYAKAKSTENPLGYAAIAAYYVRKNDLKQGIEIFKELLKKNPKLMEARDQLAAIYIKDNNVKEAEILYKEMISLMPGSPIGHNKLAALYIRSGNNEKAISELSSSLKLNPEQPEIMSILVNLYLNKNDLKMAEEIARQITAKYPKKGTGYHVLADVMYKKKDYEKAILYYEKSEKLSKNNFLSPTAIGNIYLSQGKTTKAIEAYKRALKVNPNYMPALNNLAYLYSEKKGMLDDALKLAEKAKNLLPKNETVGTGSVMDTLGWIYYKKGNYNKAIMFLKEAISFLPNEPTIRYHLGLAYIKNGMKTEARQELENALKLASNFPEAEDARKILKGLSD